MKYLILFSSLIVLAACHKSSQSDASILTAHTWYPYQIYITSVDSNSVSVTDSTGVTQTQNKVIDWDTTLSPTSCASESTLGFMQNGNLQINDVCNTPAAVTTNWTITQTNVLEFPPLGIFNAGPVNYALGGSGPVTQINSSEFAFNSAQTTGVSYLTTNGPNKSIINTRDYVAVNALITFKSK